MLQSPPKQDSLLLFKLKRQLRLIIVLTVLSFAALIVGAQFLQPTYRASSQVTVESRTPRPPVRGSEVIPELPVPFSEDVIGTEIAVISSHEIMTAIASRLKLFDDPHYNSALEADTPLYRFKQNAHAFLTKYLPLPFHDASLDADQVFADTVDTLTKTIKFDSLPRSRVIEITTTAWNPTLAAEISNMVADLYLSTHLGLTREMNEDANKFLNKRLAELQQTATVAAESVETYRQQHGLSLGATSTLLQEQISELSREVLAAKAKQDALQTQYDSARQSDPQQLSIVVGSQTMSHLREAEINASSKLAEISSRFGPQSPQVVAYAALLASARADIAAEATRALHGLKNDLNAANLNVGLLSAREQTMRDTLAVMNGSRARLATLQAQSDAANNLYGAFLNRSKETDASLLFPSADVRVISRAVVPSRPWFPRNRYIVPISGLIALTFSSLVGLLIETRRKGIVSADEIEAMFHIPTMGLIPVREAKKIYLYRDAIEHLLNRVYFGRGHHKHRTGVVVLVTSALPNEGKTTTSKALAEAAVARGLRVLLVDGDLRSFDQIESGSVGLAEVLRGEVAAAEAIRSESSLAVLSSGRSRENPIRLLSLPMAESIFQTVAMNYDLVVVDGPPVLVGGDCWMLSRHVDKTLMVVKWSSTSPTAISAALKQLNTPIDDPNLPKSAACSIVLNMVEKSRRIEDTAMMFEASNYYQQKAR
jgi:uncharacterized protein involved in exopolysaccharide biosynthesis/Mrp family chromosome partitioning ATPase